MGTRKNEKGQRFEFLVSKIDNAIKDKYYVEAVAITYALLEERTYKLLDRLKITYRKKDKIYDCLDKLQTVIESNAYTVYPQSMDQNKFHDFMEDKFIKSKLIQDIQDWRNKRNDIIHDLAKSTINYSSLRQYSLKGRKLFGKYTALIMKLKKIL